MQTPESSRHEKKEHEDEHTKRILWPIYIIVGQVLLICLAWGFFGAVRHKGQIPLPGKTAELTRDHPQSKTYVVTIVATALSMGSSYLFSQAVRHAIVVALMRPLPISQLGFGIIISRRSVIYRREPLKWVLASAILFVGTLTQTASWTSLLTPIPIDIRATVKGTEIDLTSAAINDSFTQLWNNTLQYYINSSVLSTIEDSGTARATDRAGYPAVIDFEGWTHFASTGGILPLAVHDLVVNRTRFNSSDPQSSYVITQQGLSANVACNQRSLDATTQPPVFRFSGHATTTVAGQGEPYEFTVSSLSTNCSGGSVSNMSPLFPSNTNDTVFAVGCADVDNLSAETYTVIIEGQGTSYSDIIDTVVCTISPKIQNMMANYSDGFISLNPDESSPAIPAGAAGYASVFAVLEAFSLAQNLDRNTVGDSILAIFNDQPDPQFALSFVELLEAYITGVIEFVGTAMKSDLIHYYGGYPPDTTRDVRARVFIASFGWQYSTATSWLVLLAPTFVALVSIAVIIGAQIYNRGILVSHAEFDPNNPWGLMAAASTGGMLKIFHGIDEDDVEEGLEMKVRLGTFQGRDGLVQEGLVRRD